MQQPDDSEARSRAYYDAIAADYDGLLDTPANRTIRECFWRYVEDAVPRPARILDFGAGSGFDAAHYAALGHQVTAYDLSDGMIGVLRGRCAEQIATGSVEAISGTLDDVRATLLARAPLDAIAANFAVFSTVARLDPVLRLFGELLRPGGTVLLAIQNPWYPPDMRTPGFWRALAGTPFVGAMRYSTAQLKHSFRYTPGQIRRAARPALDADSRPALPCAGTSFGPRSPFRLVALRRR